MKTLMKRHSTTKLLATRTVMMIAALLKKKDQMRWNEYFPEFMDQYLVLQIFLHN